MYRNWFFYVDTIPQSVINAYPDKTPVELWANDNGKLAKEALFHGIDEVSTLIAGDLAKFSPADKKFSQNGADFTNGIFQYKTDYRIFSGKITQSLANRFLLQERNGAFASVPKEAVAFKNVYGKPSSDDEENY